MSDAKDMAAVVIGRNEGKHLTSSLSSVRAAGLPLVYVDSGSSDGSASLARKLGVPTLDLDRTRPFSAGRARNEGLKEAAHRWPDIRYVLFLDGDSELEPAFPAGARRMMEDNPDCAIVTGHLSERAPDASVYNRLCAMEWKSPAGKIEDFGALGGIMAARISAVRSVGGFNEQVIAGEDSELGRRLALAGHCVVKIDAPMATHDARMLRFSEWWKRSVRAGHSFAQRYFLAGQTSLRDCRRELKSAILWGFLFPLVILGLLWPTRGLSLLLLIAGYALLAWRVYRYYMSSGASRSDAILATRFMLYSKFANFLGVLTFCLNWLRGSFHIIEYK